MRNEVRWKKCMIFAVAVLILGLSCPTLFAANAVEV
jgi:hypothetical protein